MVKSNSSPTTNRTINDTYNREKYNSSQTVYPEDLLSNDIKYAASYVVFYINVSEDPKAIDSRGNATGPGSYVPNFDSRVATAVQELNTTTATVIAGVAGENALAGAGLGAIGSILRGNIVGAIKGGVAATATAAIPVGILAANNIKFKRSRKRLKKTLVLHMPNEIRTNYSLVYGVADLKNFAIGVENVDGVIDAAKNMLAGGPADRSMDRLKGLGSSWASVALSAPGADGIQAATGLAPNPKKEILFNGVDFRSFSMNYQFFPKNAKEVKLIEDIIQEFKFHAHPSFLDPKKFIFKYPAEFDITFYFRDKENQHIPKISSCILMGIELNYTPNGLWAQNADGSPIQVNMSLQFKELATLTQETIAKGY